MSPQEFASLGMVISGVGVMLSMIYFSMEQSPSSFPAQAHPAELTNFGIGRRRTSRQRPHVSSGSFETGSSPWDRANVLAWASQRHCLLAATAVRCTGSSSGSAPSPLSDRACRALR